MGIREQDNRFTGFMILIVAVDFSRVFFTDINDMALRCSFLYAPGTTR